MTKNKESNDSSKKVELTDINKEKNKIKDVLIEEQSKIIRDVQGDINSENRDL